MKLDRDAGMGLPERRKMWRQDAMRERLRRGHPQPPGEAMIAAGHIAGKRQCLILHALGRGRHPSGHRRRLIGAAGKALEQRLAEPGLDRLKTPKYRGVVDPERAGSTDQTARAGHCQY
ncbi:MAG TPA: hypothetical protein VE597_04200 [Geminicoccaceae bacterium]|nr:hypothetical protein [Geminicoccaceae bacterium]